ncbi:DUF4435 domain-containing protein [Pseudomonas coleopterorum]|uniref:DUF4435 domain-containing protein n=1 Tax=Pseudomonas coleopterorum TaxID=1605838 RepID=A0ABR9C2W9_9PSED|nr:DUF4435 domain-containing protein [Pseudomonas coleopterorum]MBD8755683.1 DUF4435 domain-containing protein [Pseudomonas coleopterorum]MBD8771663.1 DUF4435 domain-containing protein [Pseudomonas coleopterorum]
MPAIPSYNIEENFRRINRQKNLTFVVVEGIDDVPIYESCLSSELSETSNYDVIYSGGKTAIRDYLTSKNSSNVIFITDRDFDDIDVTDPRLVSLDRYSIENYFICEDVIGHSLQFALGCKLRDALEVFSLDEFILSISRSVETLIKVIFYYQKVVSPQIRGQERSSWSDAFLCENESWRLCDEQIHKLINDLLPEPGLIDMAKEYYDQNFTLDGSVIENFPGKMLKHSLQRYIRHKILEIKPSARGKYNDVETTRVMLSSVMHRSRPISRVLGPVVEFVRGREMATP